MLSTALLSDCKVIARVIAVVTGFGLVACSSEPNESPGNQGGGPSSAQGGASVSGGSPATGGSTSSGGAATGGAAIIGGTTGSGGTASGGTATGSTATGGAATGGTATGGASSTGGMAGGTATGGANGTAGAATGGTTAGSGGAASGGTAAGGKGSGGMTTGGAGSSGVDPTTLPKFSFFATSLRKMVELGGTNGFGGDLRFGTSSGLEGADKICTTIAESSMAGSSAKKWRAFLSTEHGGANDGPVHAKDRIGPGPWYDRIGRLVSMNLTNLLKDRPSDADVAIKNDLPNEAGVPNSQPDPAKPKDDTHHFLTGSKSTGEWYGKDLHGNSSTCLDWTSNGRKNIATATGDGVVTGRPQIGFSFIAGTRTNWINGQTEGGCGAGITGVGMSNGGSQESNPIVGSGGGYGGIYCFALVP
jgi:hypothetical protein